ncbi:MULTISPECIES: ABC transporter permease [unclassified Virgibacillus]|uniref:ABC transporter permease n=1 Tax=unclassified Virgibacillus TaxID=2620237 RepID=UPI0024DE8F02|nr:ABC transporter permease [Virgibacillus sp. LDC-1]
MKSIWITRWLHWKKQLISLLFWLFLPLFGTIIIIQAAHAFQEDAQIPIGLVLHDDSPFAQQLYSDIAASPFVQVQILQEKDALKQLEAHDLDSVFVIEEDYGEQIQKGNRKNVITAYRSDLSFAYSPIKEMVVSLVQQETGRSKAAFYVMRLAEKYPPYEKRWSWEEITSKSKEIQKEEDLLTSTFSFFGETKKQGSSSRLWDPNPWGIWGLFLILSTFFLFDWMVKEREKKLTSRFAFMRISFSAYLLGNAFLYLLLFLIIDSLSFVILQRIYDSSISTELFLSIITFRWMTVAGSFIIALCVKNIYTLYGTGLAIVLLFAITSGVILPTDLFPNSMGWVYTYHPITYLLHNKPIWNWLALFLFIIALWYIRKENSNAPSKWHS